MSTIRTFIAVEASPSTLDAACRLIERFRTSDAKVNWVGRENLHWTIKFLGNVELTQTAEICRLAADAVADLKPFEIHAIGAGAFPHAERPRTIWIGAEEGSEPMAELATRVDESLNKLGIPGESRRFTPHLTLGRVRGPQNLASLGERLEAESSFDAGMTLVDEVVIFSSHLEPSGPVYEAIGRAELGG